MTGYEIPEDVIEKAAKRVFADDVSSEFGNTAPEIMAACEALVRVAAPVIVAWAREQALDDAEQAVLGADGFRVIGYAPRGVDEDSALRNIAALRRKEGGE